MEKRFERFEAEPLVWFKVFDTDKWPLDSASLKLFGNKEIKNLLNYYKDHNYLSEECVNTAEREWPAFKTEVVSRKNALQYVYISPYHIYKGMIRTPSLLGILHRGGISPKFSLT